MEIEFTNSKLDWKYTGRDGLFWGGPVVSSDPDVQARYLELRLAGESHNMAEILATRKFPGTKTDAIFNEGRCNGNQFASLPGLGDYYRQAAEAAGVNTVGRTYLSGLASYPGDPTAWVADRGDVLRVAREKNLTVHGYVEHQAHDTPPRPDVVLADDVIEREVQEIMAQDGGYREADVRERVVEVRTGAVDYNPEPMVSGHNFEIDGEGGV